jgi:adenine-specific DNA-methyltransferase
VRRLFSTFPPLELGFEFGVGINTGFIRDELVADKRLDDRYHPMVPGSGIARYGEVEPSGWIMYDPDYVRSRGDRGRSLPQEHLFTEPKILVVRTRNLSLKRRIVATVDTDAKYNLNRLSNIIAREGFQLLGLLGVLNSTLFNWLYATRFFDYEIKPVYLRRSPMCDVNDPALLKSVGSMLDLHRDLGNAKFDAARAPVTREIAIRDTEIDSAIYRLFGMSALEIDLVVRENKRLGG